MKQLYIQLKFGLSAFVLWGFCSAVAFAGNRVVPLEQAQGAGFQAIRNFLDKILRFMTGPWSTFIVAATIVAAVAVWIWDPKSQALGWLARIMVGAIVLFQIVAWVTTLQTG